MGFNVEMVSATSMQNGILRDLDSDGASRWATFSKDGTLLCSIQQDNGPVSLVMSPCTFSWVSNSPTKLFRLIGAAELMAEALRQAIELARQWDKDAGKPIKEVLTAEGSDQ